MTPYVVQDGNILPRHQTDFETMSRLVRELPDDVIGRTLSCHHICHALAQMFAYQAVDGHFGQGCTHTWLVLRKARDGNVVADMYPVAGATPFLVYTYWLTPWSKLYVPDPQVLEEVKKTEDFDSNVASVRNALMQLAT